MGGAGGGGVVKAITRTASAVKKAKLTFADAVKKAYR